MINNNKKTGAFIVPTGVGASIGGFAGDAGAYAREFAKVKAKTDQKRQEDLSILLSDVVRKHFHGDC